jgi:hypothetical protein
MLESVAEARAVRLVAGLLAGRPKTALADKQVRHIRALRSTGYSIKQIVADPGISRAFVFRALVRAASDGEGSAEQPHPD